MSAPVEISIRRLSLEYGVSGLGSGFPITGRLKKRNDKMPDFNGVLTSRWILSHTGPRNREVSSCGGARRIFPCATVGPGKLAGGCDMGRGDVKPGGDGYLYHCKNVVVRGGLRAKRYSGHVGRCLPQVSVRETAVEALIG